MVTELESISHIHLPLQQQAPPRSPQHLHLHPHTQEADPELPSTPSPPPDLPSPTTPTRSWSSGSVRRVRKQLEQRLKQGEAECPAPAAVPANPPTPVPSASPQQRSFSPDCAEPTVPPSQPAALEEACGVPEAGGVSVEERVERLPPESDSVELSEPSLPSLPLPLSSFPVCPDSGAQSPPLPTPPTPAEPGAQPGLLWLEGVTEMETDTDTSPAAPSAPQPAAPPLYSRLARSSEDLEKIQETLRELQAFLYEAGGARGARGADGELDQPSEKERTQQGEDVEQKEEEVEVEEACGLPRMEVLHSEPRCPVVWQRAMEIEARIRQAGLTPPSLMKRSASLAKLDCLELSTNDLSSWDFHAAPPSESSAPGGPAASSYCPQQQQQPPRAPSLSFSLSLAHPVPDDAYKKQRVLHQSPPSPRPPGLCLKEEGRTAGSGPGLAPATTPPPSPPPCPQHRPKGRQSGQDHAHAHSQPSPHGKAHPLRRLRKAADKKRTVTVLYNTM